MAASRTIAARAIPRCASAGESFTPPRSARRTIHALRTAGPPSVFPYRSSSLSSPAGASRLTCGPKRIQRRRGRGCKGSRAKRVRSAAAVSANDLRAALTRSSASAMVSGPSVAAGCTIVSSSGGAAGAGAGDGSGGGGGGTSSTTSSSMTGAGAGGGGGGTSSTTSSSMTGAGAGGGGGGGTSSTSSSSMTRAGAASNAAKRRSLLPPREVLDQRNEQPAHGHHEHDQQRVEIGDPHHNGEQNQEARLEHESRANRSWHRRKVRGPYDFMSSDPGLGAFLPLVELDSSSSSWPSGHRSGRRSSGRIRPGSSGMRSRRGDSARRPAP